MSPIYAPTPQVSLHQALVGVAIEPQVPLPGQLQALVDLPSPERPDQDVDGGYAPPDPVPLHLADDLPYLVLRRGGRGAGEDVEDAVVGEGVVPEAGDGGGGGAEEGEG